MKFQQIVKCPWGLFYGIECLRGKKDRCYGVCIKARGIHSTEGGIWHFPRQLTEPEFVSVLVIDFDLFRSVSFLICFMHKRGDDG